VIVPNCSPISPVVESSRPLAATQQSDDDGFNPETGLSASGSTMPSPPLQPTASFGTIDDDAPEHLETDQPETRVSQTEIPIAQVDSPVSMIPPVTSFKTYTLKGLAIRGVDELSSTILSILDGYGWRG
jgi:hypothetical protein